MSGFHVPANVRTNRSAGYCTNPQPARLTEHTDPVDADDAVPALRNGALNEDDGSFLWAYRSGHTSDAQKRLDPSLIHVEVVGSLAVVLYDEELCALALFTKDGDVYLENERWFAEIVRLFLAKGGRL